VAFLTVVPAFLHRFARAIRRIVGMDRERRWNRQYAEGGWDWLHNLEELAHHSVIAGYIGRLAPNGRVLDLGCGDGLLLEQLAGRVYARYVGVDFAEAIARAAHRADDKTRFIVGDINDVEPDGVFDAIVFNESLYFLWDVARGLERYERFLAPAGLFLVSMHRKGANDERWRVIDARYDVLDAVEVRNRAGTTWDVKAFRPRTPLPAEGGS